MATRLTAGKTPSKVLSNIIRLVDAAQLRAGGSLAAPGVLLPELRRDLKSFLQTLYSEQALMAYEAIWRSAAARMALAHAFLGALRVVCDPRANTPDEPTAAMPSAPAKQGLYKATNKANAGSAHASMAFEDARMVLVTAAAILGRLFIFATTAAAPNLAIGNPAAAAAEMVEELLRGDCLPMLSRLLASCTPGAPSTFKATIDGTTVLFHMLFFMFVAGMDQPHTRGLVLSPQLPACGLIELWARMGAVEAPHGTQESVSQPGSSVFPMTRQEGRNPPQSFAHAMRRSLGMPMLLGHRSDGGDPLRAVLSGPCLQYLVALQAVSQLHAADGGTLYGLPPAAVLPPELAQVEGRGSGGGDRRQGQAALSCDVLTDCISFWESCVTVQPRVPLGPLRNRGLVNLCMRLSRVALASLEGAEGAAAQAQNGKVSHSRQGQQQQKGQQRRGQSGAEAGSNPTEAPPPASGVASSVALCRPLEAGKCVSVALQSMHLAATVLQNPEMDPNPKTVSAVCSSDGGGSAASRACADLQKTSDRSAPSCCSSVGGGSRSVGSSSSSMGSGMLAAPAASTNGEGSPGMEVAGSPADSSPADTSPAAAEPPADPRLCSRSFGRRWWPLAVEVVRAALRQPGGMDSLTFARCCSVLDLCAGYETSNLDVILDKFKSLLDQLSDALAGSVATREDEQQRSSAADLQSLSTIPPGLAAALSAGLLPTLTDLARSSCGAASGGPMDTIDVATTSQKALSAAKNLARVYGVARGGELLLLLSHADAGQAATLLTALSKATRGLMSLLTSDFGTKGPSSCTISLLVMRFSSTFSSVVSGLLPPEETRGGHCAWAWPRDGGGDSGDGSPAAAAAAVAPAYRQMLRLASFVLHTWLPVLARMHEYAGDLKPNLTLQLQRCVTLAARACRAAWRRGDARAVGSWRQLLQRNVCAARWVGAEVIACWEAEGWWSGAVELQQGVEEQGAVAAGAGLKQQQQGEEGRGQAGGGEKEEEAWPYPLPLAPCESAALLRT